MIIAVDWDGTVVVQDGRPYDDVTSPFVFMPGARDALVALKRANHTLILYSARANRALRFDPKLDPLVSSGKKQVDLEAWRLAQALNQARFDHMIAFARQELPGIFDAIDDGRSGKPNAQLFIDDKALRFGISLSGSSWTSIATEYGAPVARRSK